ncbi:MAG TPA: 4,5-DOPA dioxygenase extradiol [Bacteroidia bacterium]|nr:4,5-DOPA dioxygenase extradiol [Bacteroidia bacterium]
MERRKALQLLGLGAAGTLAMKLPDLKRITDELPQAEKMPALFIGHGSPMNAIDDNVFTRTLNEFGSKLEKPSAALVISAHWLTRGTAVSTTAKPETIYDFGGFPPELYKVIYPAKGSPETAKIAKEVIRKVPVSEDEKMGLDHGAWSILKHIWPEANVPVFQLSIDFYKSPRWHYELGQELMELRKKGVMIIGSGNIVHNLGRVDFNNPAATPESWATEFDEAVKSKIISRDHEGLINYLDIGASAKLAVPTNDHYLPLLYALALQEKNETFSFPYEGFQHANIGMRCLRIG